MTASEFSSTDDGVTADKLVNGIERILGAYGERGSGPLLLVIAGLHGNETGGIEAARRVFSQLRHSRPSIRGRAVAFAGNLAALRRGERFIDCDLNRIWIPDDLCPGARSGQSAVGAEQIELRELKQSIGEELDGGCRDAFLIDLHSTSAKATPFCIVSDTLQNRQIAFALSIPVMLGLEESIKGTIQEYFGELGIAAATVEGGQHQDPATADYLESCLWTTLVSAGLLSEEQVPEFARHRGRLQKVTNGLPSVVEITYRHGLHPDDDFEMKPGFTNFSPVRKGQLVASDRQGEICASEDALLVMPSYQAANSDGFFLGRRVRRFWLRLSTVLRRLRLDTLVHWLPGVRRDPERAWSYLVDPHLARWLVLDIFHVLGFRRCGQIDDQWVFRRRREGWHQRRGMGTPSRAQAYKAENGGLP